MKIPFKRVRKAMWFALALATTGNALAARHEDWKRVERLAPGAQVDVELNGQPPEICRVIAADDASLTCAREADPNTDWRPGDNARVVLPRATVWAIWVWEDVSYRRLLMRLGIGFAVGAVFCSELGSGPAFVCGGLGALFALDFPALDGPRPIWGMRGLPQPIPPRRARDIRRRLLYDAPRSASPSAAL